MKKQYQLSVKGYCQTQISYLNLKRNYFSENVDIGTQIDKSNDN